MQEEIRKQLWALADPNYRKFSEKLIPGARNILGVSAPNVQKIARQILKMDWENYLRTANDDSFESIMLQGLVIGSAPIPTEQRLVLIGNFLPKIDNWAICDSFCGHWKIRGKDRELIWDFLQPFFRENRPFYLRFALIMLFKFIDGVHIDFIFLLLPKIRSNHRYVQLAIAWLVAECCLHFPEKTLRFLKSQTLDKFTQNRAIQKINESLRIAPSLKEQVRQWKQK
ncbi:MAG: DNA alkylation repair protein [Puniceicoccales bacterium]|jgi:3-methyladenine DNA glycosylase AlkD|nr:DNA alkylation repair protein [Puniceicoccales bacterium]